jgi:hypothetical protein
LICTTQDSMPKSQFIPAFIVIRTADKVVTIAILKFLC